MDLSVVIPVRNEEHLLGQQLDALLAQVWDGVWEVIVVDNGSTDGTADLVERYAARDPRVRYLLAADRADQSHAANAGVRASDAPSVAFCDADDIVCEGWVAAMAGGLADHQVVTGPNLLERLNPSWLAPSRGPSAAEPVGSFFGIFPLVRGNNYGVRKEVWDITGPLAEGFTVHGVLADQEFSLRCWLHDIAVVGLPDAAVHYRYRQDGRSLWRQGLAYGMHRPLIARMLREAGKPGPPRFAGWKSWVLLLIRLPTVVTRHGRARWLWIAGNRFGQVIGSIRHRTLML
ncbi:MAG: glycosyltransferase family 2 protein [Acidimicrobiales bacterium]